MYLYSKKIKGFTLVEMMVSVGIIMIILSVILFNQSQYTENAAISNLADEISLTISQAQAYGIAVKELTPGSSDFSASYGISASILETGSPTDYLLYADRNGNDIYDGAWECGAGGSSECLEKVAIGRGNYIGEICVVRTSAADQCSVHRVDISFERPATEANLVFFNSGGQVFSLPNTKGARIRLVSPNGLFKSVVVYSSGQISVENE